ncbi:MAG: hypothetical protein ACRDE7_03470 [Sphingobacterium sp.]
MMDPKMLETIAHLDWEKLVSEERKSKLLPLIDFIQEKVDAAQ